MIAPSPIAKGIAAVLVTMNRRDIVETCLHKLAAQTLRPEIVWVINNASTDGTGEFLAQFSAASGGWIVHRELEQNLGNAGGMALGLQEIFAGNFAAAWILDDDSWPEPEALARLLEPALVEPAVRSCRVVDLATGALSWPLQVPEGNAWRLIELHDPLPAGKVLRIRRSWLGALLPRAIYEVVGPVEGRLFLRGEDEDYPRRIEAAAFEVFLVTDSLLHHPAAGRLHCWQIAGYTLILESHLAEKMLYYRLRNAVWLTRRNRGVLLALGISVLYAAALWRWERPLSKWLGIWWEASTDAIRDRMGMRAEAKRPA